MSGPAAPARRPGVREAGPVRPRAAPRPRSSAAALVAVILVGQALGRPHTAVDGLRADRRRHGCGVPDRCCAFRRGGAVDPDRSGDGHATTVACRSSRMHVHGAVAALRSSGSTRTSWIRVRSSRPGFLSGRTVAEPSGSRNEGVRTTTRTRACCSSPYAQILDVYAHDRAAPRTKSALALRPDTRGVISRSNTTTSRSAVDILDGGGAHARRRARAEAILDQTKSAP